MNSKTMYFTVEKTRGEKSVFEIHLRVLCVLEGTVSIAYQDVAYTMNQGDLCLLFPGIEVETKGDALVAEAVYNLSYLSSILPEGCRFFSVNSALDDQNSYQDLRDLFSRLTAEYTVQTHHSDLWMDSLLLQVVDTLVEHYQVGENSTGGGFAGSDQRMQQIFHYIVTHLDQDISLSELADSMYFSTSTLSRLFKKNTGMYFADYVMKLRVEASLPELDYSDAPLTQIALSCGFANSAAFSRAFRKTMNMTPTQYRQQHREEAKKRREEEEKQQERIRQELKNLGYEKAEHDSIENVFLDLAAAESASLHPNWNRIINIGALFDLTRANIQFHVSFLQKEGHYTTVRLWNVFSQRMLFTDGTSGVYNFDLYDQTLDFLVQQHLTPFLDFGRRPDMALRPDGKRVFFNDDYIPFADARHWQNAVCALLQHLATRYGIDEISGWTYELTFDAMQEEEGRAFYGGAFRYYDAWNFFCREVRRRIPGAEVGGSGASITMEEKELEHFLDECIADDCVPSFLSFRLFPMDDVRVGTGRDNRAGEEHQIRMMRSLMEKKDLSRFGTKLYITEWNNSISNRNFLNDSCFRAAYIVNRIGKMTEEVDEIAIMSGSDWISNYMDTPAILYGGIGILSKDTIQKPAFYALDFLSHLGEEILARGEHYIVTRTKGGELRILCSYFSWFLRNEKKEGQTELERWQSVHYEKETPLHLVIEISHLPQNGTWTIRREILNSEHGSILDTWAMLGYDTTLSRRDVKYLSTVTTPALAMEKVQVAHQGSRIRLELTMEPQEVSFISLYPTL